MGEPATFRQDDFLTAERPVYLITGATGFLGGHIIRSLARDAPGARLIALLREAGPQYDALPAELRDVEVLRGPLTPTDTWNNDSRLDGLTGIFHVAAEVKHARSGTASMIQTNVAGTEAMVRLAADRKCRLVFVSTSGTVGCSSKPGPGPYEDAPYCEDVVRRWPYYLSKIRAEQTARRLATELGVDLVIFRPPILLGPGDHRFRSTAHLLRLLRNKLPFIFPSHLHFVDVRDAADAMVRAMLLPNPRPIYHLTGTVCSLNDFFRMVARAANIKPRWHTLNARLVWAVARLAELARVKIYALPNPVIIEMGMHNWEISSRHAERDLGYASRPPEETIEDTVAWLRANHPELAQSV